MDPHSFIARAEAQRWVGIAEKLLMGHDLVGSKTFAIRARDSDPRLEAADQILAIADTLLAAEKRVVGNNGAHQPDFYAILQLVRFVQDTEHIASQYRRLAVLLNPHQNRFPYSDQAFQLVNDAWAVLSNPMRKSMYDAELDFPPPQQQMNTIGFNLEQQHHQQQQQHHQQQQQQQHNFFSINHMGAGHEQELPEQPQTFQTRLQQSHQQQQLQQHNFLSQPNPVRPLPVREQEHLFQPQVQPFQVTSSSQQQNRQPPQPQAQPPIQSPPRHQQPAAQQAPFSWPQTTHLSQPQQQQEHFLTQQQPQLQQQVHQKQLKQEQQLQQQIKQEQLQHLEQQKQQQLQEQRRQQEQQKQQQLKQEQQKQQQLKQEQLKQQQLKQEKMQQEQLKQQQLLQEQRRQQEEQKQKHLQQEQQKQQQMLQEQRRQQEEQKQQQLLQEQRRQQEEQKQQQLREEQQKQQQLLEEQRKQQQLLEEQRRQQEEQKQKQLWEEEQKQKQLREEEQKQQQLLEEQRRQQEEQRQKQLREEEQKQKQLREEQQKQQQLLEEQRRQQEEQRQKQLREEEQKQQQLLQEQLRQQESIKHNASSEQLPNQVNSSNGAREEETEAETADEDADDSPTFWTACPYCFYMYEYPRVYAECTLCCDNCKRAFQAVRITCPPPIIEGQDAYFYCWGFIPVGVRMSHLQKNNSKGTNSKWTPFSPLYDASNNGQNHLNCNAAPKENLFVNKSSGPRIYIDDISDDMFIDVSESSDDSDFEWNSYKEQKLKRMKKGLNRGFKERVQVLALRALDVRNGSVKNLKHGILVQEGVKLPTLPVAETNMKAVGTNPRKQSGRVAKELGKLDLNVEFNNNEGEEPAPRMTGGNRGHGHGHGHGQGEDGFFEGLDEFLSSLPILSVVNEEKVKA